MSRVVPYLFLASKGRRARMLNGGEMAHGGTDDKAGHQLVSTDNLEIAAATARSVCVQGHTAPAVGAEQDAGTTGRSATRPKNRQAT